MRNLFITMLVLLAAACGGSQAQTGPSGFAATVSGRVVDFEAGVGASGITVAFGEATAVTDAGGSYTLALPIGGFYEPFVDGVRAGTSRVTATVMMMQVRMRFTAVVLSSSPLAADR